MGITLMIIGILICFVCSIMILIESFKTSVLWGLGFLFVPFVSLIFIIMNFQAVKKPFLYYLLGFVLMVLAMVISPELAQK